MSRTTQFLAIACLCLFASLPTARAERIKDIADIAGVRENQLIGYGLVVGLAGTGDQTNQTPFTVQGLKNMFTQLGIVLPPNFNPQLRNLAAVMVTASLPAFAKPGQTIDVTVSSLGNAKSLRGGLLLMTPLKGADGSVYAVAQGNLTVGGFGAETADGSSVTVNIPSSGRIPNGATVERMVPSPFSDSRALVFNLKRSDFTNASRMVAAIDSAFGAGRAQALDATSVQVAAPMDPAARVAFVAQLQALELDPDDAAARVVVNSRTGTVVIGRQVRVKAAAISHGSLTVTIAPDPVISQPGPLSGGTTAVVPRSNIEVTEENNRMFLFQPGVELGDIVEAVNGVGAAPGDLVAILEALKQAGALSATLEVI
jgi:flagellar P-ring protein FlgI